MSAWRLLLAWCPTSFSYVSLPLPPIGPFPLSKIPMCCSASTFLLPVDLSHPAHRPPHLSGLQVAQDLCHLHDTGMLHRHVTIASIAVARSGNLATARLMPHPFNIYAGPARRHLGPRTTGTDAYLAPELARCPLDAIAHTPACDLWALGVVLFVLLSGSHVPFGNRGLCWTSIPNMPRPNETVDRLQKWLQVGCLLSWPAAQACSCAIHLARPAQTAPSPGKPEEHAASELTNTEALSALVFAPPLPSSPLAAPGAAPPPRLDSSSNHSPTATAALVTPLPLLSYRSTCSARCT